MNSTKEVGEEPRWRNSLPLLILVFICSPLDTTGAHAGDFNVDAQVVERFSLDDNLQQVPGSSAVVFGSTTSLLTGVDFTSKTFDVNFDSDLGFRKFIGGDDDELNGLEQSYQLGFVKRSKRLQVNVATSLSLQNTTFSEFEDSGLLNEEDALRLSRSLSGSATYSINERSTASVNASVNTTDFTEDTTTLSPFVNLRAGGSFSHKFTNRLQLTTTGSWSLFDSEGAASSTSQTFAGNIGGTYSLTKRLNARANGGLSFVNTQNATTAFTGNENTIVRTFDLGLDYATADTQFGVSFARSTNPSTLGELQTTSVLRVFANHTINSRSNLGVNVTASLQADVTDPNGTGGDDGRNFLSVNTSYSRTLSQKWRGNLAYNLRVQDSAGQVSVSNNIVMSFIRDINVRP